MRRTVSVGAIWAIATLIFLWFIVSLGQPSTGDNWYYQYSLWAIEHGNFVCAYPPKFGPHLPLPAVPFTFIAPLYPLVAGAIAALLHVGTSHPFPSVNAMGAGCRQAMTTMWHWARQAHVEGETLAIAFTGWFALIAGVIVHRGRTRRLSWRDEIWSAMLLVSSLAVVSAFAQFSHPQDLLAAGLSWVAVATALRDRWMWTGILIGLATSSNQLALLAAIVLFVVAGRDGRRRLVTGAVLTMAVVYTPLLLAGGTRAYGDILTGSGFNNSLGGTLVWQLGLPVPLKYFVSRIVPLAVDAAFALWYRRRHDGPIDAAGLVFLVTMGFAWRLVFEANLWGYYFVPLFAGLVILDRTQGRRRAASLAWSLSQLLLYNWLNVGYDAPSWLLESWPLFLGLLAAAGTVAVMTMRSIQRKKDRIAWSSTLILYVAVFVVGPHVFHTDVTSWPVWVHQIILVPWAIGLAISGVTRAPSEERSPEDLGEATVPVMAQWDPGSDRGTLGG